VQLLLDIDVVLPDLLESVINHSLKVGEVVAEIHHLLPRIAIVLSSRVDLALEAGHLREYCRDMIVSSCECIDRRGQPVQRVRQVIVGEATALGVRR